MRLRHPATVALLLTLAALSALAGLGTRGALGVLDTLGTLGVGSPGVARADGDPASDVLVSQDVFLPYRGISPALQRRLFVLGLMAAAAITAAFIARSRRAAG